MMHVLETMRRCFVSAKTRTTNALGECTFPFKGHCVIDMVQTRFGMILYYVTAMLRPFVDPWAAKTNTLLAHFGTSGFAVLLAICHVFVIVCTSAMHILLYSREHLRRVLRKKAANVIHQHIYRSTSSHICRSTSSHICRSTSSHICRSTSSPICRSTSSHICRSTSSHICKSTSSHICRSTSADLHNHTSADLHLFMSADLFSLSLYVSLSLFFLSLLRRGRCRRTATKRNPFARNGRRASKAEV